MSVCICPTCGIDGMDSPEHKKRVNEFLQQVNADWSFDELIQMAQNGCDLATIESSIPFRGGPCSRTMRCCGVCTRRCKHRCIQDCLQRLYMWKKMPITDETPLGIRLIVTQKFTSHEQLSMAVSEILSSNTNKKLKEYMKNANLRPEENPYKMDYGPQVCIDTTTGKRIVDPDTGELRYRNWPRTGLCPYCLPEVTVDGRVIKRGF